MSSTLSDLTGLQNKEESPDCAQLPCVLESRRELHPHWLLPNFRAQVLHKRRGEGSVQQNLHSRRKGIHLQRYRLALCASCRAARAEPILLLGVLGEYGQCVIGKP